MILLACLYLLTASVFYLLFTTEVSLADGELATLRLWLLVLMLPIFFKYLVQLLSAPWYPWLEKRRNQSSGMQLPRVTVLIPAWNEEVGILRTLQSVLNTGYSNLELVVINDGSTDGTHQLVSNFIARHKSLSKDQEKTAQIRYLNLSNGGKARALNRGLEVATGEFVMTLDADSLVDAEAIERMLPRFADPKVGAVAGNVIVGNRKKPIALLQQLEYLYGFFFKRADSIFNAVYIIGGAAAAYRKQVLDKLGGFDHRIITEDIEMSTRILREGYKTRFAADSVVYTEGPSDWRGLCQQRLRWKFGRLLTFIKHRQLFFNARLGNPYLCFLLLPVALYAELSLLFEVVFLGAFFGYTIYASDYLPLACVIAFMSTLIALQIHFDARARFHRNILGLAPVAWLLFYVIDAVELQALVRSINRLVRRQQPEWQKWVRKGLQHKAVPVSESVEGELADTVMDSLAPRV